MAKPGTCIITLGVFLSVAGTPGFGFQSVLWALLVISDSQGDGFPVCRFREVQVACVSPELGSGTRRDFDLGLLQVWTIGFYQLSSSATALQYDFRKTISPVTMCQRFCNTVQQHRPSDLC